MPPLDQPPSSTATRARQIAALCVLITLWASGPSAPIAADTEVLRLGGDGRMVLVPSGPFVMGSDIKGSAEGPAHEVFLRSFYIDRFEVTNSDYDICVSAGVCAARSIYTGKQRPRQPAVGISWSDAVAFCRFRGHRLPTEAEWEKAARGTDGRLYPWGNEITCGMANFGNGVSRECPEAPRTTADVGSYPLDVSPYGVYDMAGNVWEYVQDYYDPNYYKVCPASNPQGPSIGQGHVLKGGSWYTTKAYLRVTARTGRRQARTEYDGFRCATDRR